MMTTPEERKGKLKRQILNAARLPRWEPTFGILIGGYFILCQSDICNFGDPSQRLAEIDLDGATLIEDRLLTICTPSSTDPLVIQALNEYDQWKTAIEEHIAYASSNDASRSLDLFLPLAQVSISKPIECLDLSSVLRNNVPADIETAVVAALIHQEYEGWSGALSAGGISTTIDVGKPATMLIQWHTPQVEGVHTSNAIRKLLQMGSITIETCAYENVPPHLHEGLCDLLTRANYGMRVGHFVLDVSSGNIILRTSLHIGTGDLQETLIPMLRNILSANVKTHKHYLPALYSLIEAGESVPKAISTVEGALAGLISGNLSLETVAVEIAEILNRNNISLMEERQNTLIAQVPITGYANLIVAIRIEEGLVMVTSHAINSSPPYARNALSELVMRACAHCEVGQFNFDYRDGQILFQSELPMVGVDMNDVPALLEPLILENIKISLKFYPAFQSVIRFGSSAEEAFKSVVQQNNPHASIVQERPSHMQVPQMPQTTANRPMNNINPASAAAKVPEFSTSSFSKIRFLDRGGMGEVYCAEYNGSTVAIKQLPENKSDTEIVTQSMCNSIHLVKVLGIVRGEVKKERDAEWVMVAHETSVLLIMEYCDGGNLRTWLTRTSASANDYFDEITVVSWMLDIAKGMADLHAQNIIHRDLKPENIFLYDYQSRAKIGDFGLAKKPSRVMNENESLSAQVQYTLDGYNGTLHYIAPESFSNREYSHRSDCYSYGIILFDVFVKKGHPTFSHDEVLGTTPDPSRYNQVFSQKIISGALRVQIPPDSLSYLSNISRDRLQSLILACTNREVLKRPKFQAIVQQLNELHKGLINNRLPSATGPSIKIESNLTTISTIMGRLGEGGMGTVYLSKYLGTFVALKQATIENNASIFEKEIRLQSALSHPNVVSVLGVAKARIETHRMHAAASDVQYVLKEDENAFVMINEYCPEGSLSDWMGQLREGKIAFCERQCIDIMIDVSLGMAYLHHQKILHKDLKPANILLLGGARKAKIGDFGLAKVTKRRPQDIGRSRTYIEVEKNGSLFFIAPEVCREGVCTVAADVFSFGIILHNVFDSWRELLSYPPNRVLYPDFGIEAYEQVFLHKLLEDDFRPLFSPQQDSKMSPLVYDEIVSLAAKCWDVDWRKRPSFPDIVEILRSLKSRAEEALCMEPKAAEFGTNDNNSTQGMSRVSDTRVDAFAYPPGRENSTASKPSPTRSELMGNQHGAGAPTPPGFGQPGLQLAPLVKERQVSSTPPGFGRPDRPLTLAPPGFGRRSPPQAPPFSAESPVLPRQYYDWQLVRPAPLVNERQVSLVTGNDRNCIHINQDSMCRRTITDESFLSGSFGSGGACNPEVLSSPPSLTFFLPIEKLSAMETALELPQDNVSSSVSLIAKSLGLEDDIESIPTLKNKVQRLWKEFEDSEEELNEISQLVPAFNLVECVQRIKKDLRIGDKETLVEIIYEASVLLGIEKECNKLPTIKLRTKRICIDLGHLPEELLTILESL